MRYFLDAEFDERPCTIDLISLGIASEAGPDFYAESSEYDWRNADEWLEANVKPHLLGNPVPRTEIRDGVLNLIGRDPQPEFWGYNCAHDWVVFCWLFGRLVDLPSGWPHCCRDLKDRMEQLGIISGDLPEKPKNSHNSLADARWERDDVWPFLDEIDQALNAPFEI